MQIWLLHLIQMATAVNHNAEEMLSIAVDTEKKHKFVQAVDLS